MGDPRTIIERAVERVAPRTDAFERLERRRQRRLRNRRITAGVVAMMVAIGGSYAVFQTFRNASGTTPAGAEGFHALWPATTLEEARTWQERSDSGETPYPLTDAVAVADAFAVHVLGWTYAVVSPYGTSADLKGPGPVVFELTTPPKPCPSPSPGQSLPVACSDTSAKVTLERLGRQDPTGIWSVVSVSSEFDGSEIVLPLQPGQDVLSGTELGLPFRWPFGAKGSAGYVYLSTCGANSVVTGPVVRADSVTFAVADLMIGDACHQETGSIVGSSGGGIGPAGQGAQLDAATDGYVFFVMTPNQVPADNPLDPNRPATAAQDSTVLAFAAVPVHFVPVGSRAPALPTTAQMTCDGQTTELSTPAVLPQPDGVHIAVENTSAQDLGLEVQDVGGENAPQGTSDTIWQIGPGSYEVRCTSPLPNADVGPFQPLEVQDPDHLWVSTDLDCDSVTGTASAVAPGVDGEKGMPVEILERHLTGLQANDTVEAAGYSNSSEPMIRIVRDDKVIALYHFMSDGQGGWLVDSSQQCSNANLGWNDPSSARFPRGWFEWCPDVSGTLPFGSSSEQEAADAALKFAQAYLSGNEAVMRELTDPAVPPDANWTIAGTPEGVSVGASAQADPGRLVEFGCGPEVASRTWAVFLDDGTNSASADFTLYLVLRDDGWKVWGAY